MEKTKFNPLLLDGLKPTDSIYEISSKGEPGFCLRVYPSGVKTFFFRYKIDGIRRFMTLGDYSKSGINLKAARDSYQAEVVKVKALRKGSKDGLDPVLEKKKEAEKRIQAETERVHAPTVKELCEEYINRYAKRFKRSWSTDERILNHDIIPAWGKRKAADITKRDIVLVLEKIVGRNAPGMANNTFQLIRKMFNWSVEQSILTISPCIGIKLPAPKQSRDRVFTEAEIKAFWSNLDDCAISGGIKRALRLILLTAQRPGEVIGIHTSEIDGNWWTIPAERSKNGKANRVFLAPLAQELIAAEIQDIKRIRKIPAAADYKGFIFPSPVQQRNKVVDGNLTIVKIIQPIAGQALVVAVIRNLAFLLTDKDGKPLLQKDGKPATVNKFGIDHFTPHDLRRTAATFMAQQGEMDEVIDAILNHSKQGVIKVYNQYRYDREKQLALETWERKLNSIITGAESKVVSIQQGRKQRANQ